MSSEGPSPLVPSLMVGALGWVIFGPSFLSIMDSVLPWAQAGDPDSGNFYVLLGFVLLLLLVLVQLLSKFFPTPRLRVGMFLQTRSSSAGSDDGFGLGTLLFVLMFLVLYNFWSD
ncbi:hypothetical protein ERO13_D08G238000v2 [Gossypium hirsutum]|uniref:Uncharacterized protein n=4 Tax=Gossypium TaxID=3633 RepID=A0A2P5XBX5_GOSBA|nr:hypothetical protein ES319_D08G261700v1 [Gossypium barbadense]KAG4135781.1 hypothetical protein ERO13_D08G238000v2 [Gossypium hirsutum]TYG59084.1 hypothetical protein ES288_D08G274000v1 [Gossypium darwinii]TYI71021.1 hypothetical protein E1A91_D08G264700v1 [Gossypium mustelinum]PPD72625.1 hypothetical protein GOBAR_DD30485 [Gossypium barbadense]